METTTILIFISAFIFLVLVGFYNRFVNYKNRARNAFSNIDVMLRKRYDLIPTLVDTVKGYMQHETTLLSEVTILRSQAQHPKISQEQKVELNNALSASIGKVLVAVEAYPDLKASSNFLHLQRSIAEMEEQLSASRRSYNMAVTQYNTLLESFPSNLVGKLFNFKRKCLFRVTYEETKAPSVQLN